ncbi:MAG: hypothetical protein A2854_01755 [Parcubacteria group bacterium RIFCSPHIGHO2_01_FULL_56_18]|nr:MAG: hypothetical protein A2854_01755 [Parcubacteria group bacterium RIFCSPHIGHO2_01_FULL_56_18]
MKASHFFIYTSPNRSNCIATFGHDPLRREELAEMLGANAHLEHTGQLESTVQKFWEETYQGEAFALDPPSSLLRIYEFFAAGWNAAAEYTNTPAQRMTVELIRELVRQRPNHESVGVVAHCFKKLKFDAAEECRISRKEWQMILLLSFQMAFVVCARRFGQ